MGLGELRQALVGLTSEDSEGQAEEEQGSCRGNSRENARNIKKQFATIELLKLVPIGLRC